jgi:predicted ATPase
MASLAGYEEVSLQKKYNTNIRKKERKKERGEWKREREAEGKTMKIFGEQNAKLMKGKHLMKINASLKQHVHWKNYKWSVWLQFVKEVKYKIKCVTYPLNPRPAGCLKRVM